MRKHSNIELFFPRGQKLNEIIGTELNLDGRWIMPLPHPSGASRWHQSQDNRTLIDQAIALIRARIEKLQPF